MLIVYDFDGVMTDNKVYVNPGVGETIRCDRRDGWAVRKIKELGHRQIILTNELNRCVANRAMKLNIECYQVDESKAAWLCTFADRNVIPLDSITYVGDGLNDLETMLLLHDDHRFCPRDAHPNVKRIARVLDKDGGDAVILELFQTIFV